MRQIGGMDEQQTQQLLTLHWPGLIPQARREEGRFVVRLLSWPPKPNPEMEARSPESYEAALLDLATWSPPMRCRQLRCVLCSRD
jgi:hypothetical protein